MPITLPITARLNGRAVGRIGCMAGSVRERSIGSWEVRVYAGLDAVTGRRRYRSATVRGSRRDAHRAAKRLELEVRVARTAGEYRTVGAVLEAWFVVASASWAPTTIRQTRSVLDRYLHPHLGDVRIADLTPVLIDATYVRLRASGSVRGTSLAAGTLARIHVVLRSALGQAQRWGWIVDNPALRVHRIVVTSRELHPPTPSEVRQLLTHLAAVDSKLHLFALLAATTGARRAQLLGLRWENIGLEAGRVEFCAGWVEGPNGPTLAPTKTKRRHGVELDRATHAAVVAVWCDGMAGFMFSDDDGRTAWKPNRVTKDFVRARRAAGLREFRLHDLRHFMATEMLHAGVPLSIVSRRLDHQRVSTTLNCYAHAVPGGDASAAETLAALLDASNTGLRPRDYLTERRGVGEPPPHPTAGRWRPRRVPHRVSQDLDRVIDARFGRQFDQVPVDVRRARRWAGPGATPEPRDRGRRRLRSATRTSR